MKETRDFLHGFRRDKFLTKNRPSASPGNYRDTKFADHRVDNKKVKPKKFQ